jgi:hypothetical protein
MHRYRARTPDSALSSPKKAIFPYESTSCNGFRRIRAPPGNRTFAPLPAGGARCTREWPMETTRWRDQRVITCMINTLVQAYVAINGHGYGR